MRTLDKKLWRDLRQMSGQAITIALVVACGVASLVAALSTYDSLQWTQQNYYATANFAHLFASVKRAPTALRSTMARLPGVAEVEARVVFDVTLDLPGVAVPAVGRMIALPATGEPEMNRLYLRSGRLPQATHLDEVLVSEGFAKAHAFRPGDTLRALINGTYQTLRIVGVALSPEYIFAVRGAEALPDDRQFGIVWIAHSALAAAFNMEGAFNNVVLRLAPGASQPQVIERLDALLAPYGGLGALPRAEQVSHRFLSDEIQQQGTMATTMPPIFIAVAAFLLNVVLTRLVSTQREQIATLKALGYTNLAVLVHYIKLVSVITLAGIGFGVALGSYFGYLLTANYVTFFHFPVLQFRLLLWIPLLAGAISLVAAVLAVWNAIRRVVSLAPAEAMRPPAPRVYRRSVLEGVWLWRRLSPQGRMAWRSLLSRPLRACFTVLGIALALPILILGLFWRDAIDAMMAVQFTLVDRSDALVSFTEPVNTRAQRQLARLPGVTAVEGVRAVPVRLRAGHRTYRTAVLGLPQDAELRRVFDANLQHIPIPPAGVLLPDRLGKRLGVGVGDTIILEVLEGERAQPMTVVAGLVYETMGVSAYMEIGALRRLLHEGDTISLVSMLVEPSQAQAVYARLKQLPRVATVSIKALALQSFTDTTATFVLVFSGVLTSFAMLVAVGIVYNNARIALAERAWELASLRVLGFSRRQVSAMLLTELGLEVLLALPLGCWLGYLFAVAIIWMHQTETFAIPAIIAPRSYAMAILLVLVAAVVSALIVRRRIDQLDLIGALKTRE